MSKSIESDASRSAALGGLLPRRSAFPIVTIRSIGKSLRGHQTVHYYGVGQNCLELGDVEYKLLELYDKRAATGKPGYDTPLFTVPVALIYGQPDSEAMDQFRKRMKYYHHRSADFVEIFAIGYYNADDKDDGLLPELDHFAFAKAVHSLEDTTKWKYSGQTDLIFLYFKREVTEDGLNHFLDFSNAVSITIEEAVDCKLISSGGDLLERIIRITRSDAGLNFVQSLSTNLTSGAMKFGFLSWLANTLKIDKTAFKAVGLAAPANLSR